MQKALSASHPDIHLLAVNAAGYSSGLGAMSAEGDLPLLQDHPDVNAWDRWGVEYRDVVILGRSNERLGAYNLTEHNLDEPANYAALEQLLTDAAASP